MDYFKNAWLYLLVVTVFTSCGKDAVDTSPLVLSYVPIDFSKLESVVAFGEEINAEKKSPAIEYILLDANADIHAMASGYVEALVMNEGFADYEIRVRNKKSPDWLVIYDHILDVKVSEGDPIDPGMVLGKVGIGQRTEIQLNIEKEGTELSYCPLSNASPEFVTEHQAFMSDWCLEDSVAP
ncbi:peptidoglycan DD-metalloendopeptidase family protein [Zobellia uliginosa]|uniref:peptidoglycan DD-metalloendopeptidase family protein n=1 Tax=Zobellia uliginosa TaxID=143224 RepID=UPI0026E32F94|nr:peptidoglycan DD-metalloendopeptidase family protein [Zobellia uliginosa]MDO6519411.1 peptidoglycan DD-metalloendopeptidase family protein [Zobellia uliginosa]